MDISLPKGNNTERSTAIIQATPKLSIVAKQSSLQYDQLHLNFLLLHC